MYDLKRYTYSLELDKVLQMLAELTTMSDAREKALSLLPSDDFNTVSAELKETEDAYLLTAKFSSPNFGRIDNVNSALARASAGGMLSMGELLQIAETLRVIRGVKQWRENCEGHKEMSVDKYFSVLFPNKYFEDKITFAIKSEDEINDNASQELSSIRRKISGCTAGIRDKLDKILHSASKNKYLQESIITQRDGRFVVPVKNEYRNEVPGIVHDTSASGATLFIEPMPIVEINNELRVLKSREREEIDRILLSLSAEAADFSDSIIASYNALAHLNFVFAKSSLAYKMKASVPLLNNCGQIRLKNARHPLIPASSVVPISVEIGFDYDSLIITGANTGGKTVTLKTVGLLTVMTLCGLMIPVDDNSTVSVFDRILVDIGDEQSIEQSLSTFSSHMVNTVEIIKESINPSLVLLDELGAGTDPVEGAALARSILEQLYLNGAKTVATTHYAELKAYALETERIENACCEFDVNTLRPTYRLLIGIPGRSNAFAISERLGLDKNIIDRAKNYVTEEDMRFDAVVSSLESAKVDAENEKREITKMRIQMAKEKEALENELKNFDMNKAKIEERARAAAASVVNEARDRTNRLLNELETLKKELDREHSAEMLAKARSSVKKELSEIEEIADPVSNQKAVGEKPENVKPGDTVLLAGVNKKATVLDVKNNKVRVAAGNMQLTVDIDDLLKYTETVREKKPRNISGITSRAERSLSGEIDIRGMASDEGIMELDKYIDNAVLTGLNKITVIHGKGTGVLRKAVHAHLKTHKNVASYRLGVFGEGEMGVTIIELKG